MHEIILFYCSDFPSPKWPKNDLAVTLTHELGKNESGKWGRTIVKSVESRVEELRLRFSRNFISNSLHLRGGLDGDPVIPRDTLQDNMTQAQANEYVAEAGVLFSTYFSEGEIPPQGRHYSTVPSPPPKSSSLPAALATPLLLHGSNAEIVALLLFWTLGAAVFCFVMIFESALGAWSWYGRGRPVLASVWDADSL